MESLNILMKLQRNTMQHRKAAHMSAHTELFKDWKKSLILFNSNTIQHP